MKTLREQFPVVPLNAKYLVMAFCVAMFFVSLFVFSPLLVGAYSLEFDPNVILADKTDLGTRDPAGIVFEIVNTALIFLGLMTVIIIIISGFMWLTAGGVEDKIKKAKDLLKGAVIGLVIVLASYGLAQYIFTALVIATQKTTT